MTPSPGTVAWDKVAGVQVLVATPPYTNFYRVEVVAGFVHHFRTAVWTVPTKDLRPLTYEGERGRMGA